MVVAVVLAQASVVGLPPWVEFDLRLVILDVLRESRPLLLVSAENQELRLL